MPDLPAILGNSPFFPAKVPLIRPVLPTLDELQPGIQGILTSGMVTKGQHLRAFEQAVAAHLGVKHAIAVSSCTTGLMLTYKTLGLTGDVIVPSFTFMATVSALVWAGLRPVFADVDGGTTNLDPQSAERAITPQTSAIVAVHNYGNPANIAALTELATRHKIKLIFDAAHGFGTLYQEEPVGAQGNAQIFSLSPTKLVIAGEGGIVTTQDDALAEAVQIGREYGNDGHYDSRFAGFNARMPEFNALMGLHSLQRLEEAAQHRNRVAAWYREGLQHLPGISFQTTYPGDRNSYKDFSVFVDADQFGLSRDDLAIALQAENVETRKYYDPVAHHQTAYRHFIPAVSLAVTERLEKQVLSLPIWSQMEADLVKRICAAIDRIWHHGAAIQRRIAHS